MLCIGSLGGLSSQATSNAGSALGVVGVTIGVLSTLKLVAFTTPVLVQFAVVSALGGALGTAFARKITPTELPEMVALLHSFVGFAAVLTSAAAYAAHPTGALLHLITTYLGVLIGGITATGSLVAYAKLKGLMTSKPLNLPMKNALNIAMVTANAGAMGLFLSTPSFTIGLSCIALNTLLSFVLGWHTTASIGGGDGMPCWIIQFL